MDPELEYLDVEVRVEDGEPTEVVLLRTERTLSDRIVQVALWVMLAVGIAVIVALIPVGTFAVRPMDCGSCHNERAFVDATAASRHSEVDCISCHSGTDPLSRVDFGFRQAYGMATPVLRDAQRDAAIAYDDRCTGCHNEGLTEVVQRDGIRIDHAKCTVDLSCLECHGGLAHGTSTGVWINVYTMDLCLGCHNAAEVNRDCGLCHDGRRAGDRPHQGAWAITHGPDWLRTHGMGDLKTCAACHEQGKCSGCHGAGVPHGSGFYEAHGDVAQDPIADCTSCHRESFCGDCHGPYPMPHPVTFIKEHSATARQDGDLECRRCHTREDCDQCHAAHIHPGGSISPPGGDRR